MNLFNNGNGGGLNLNHLDSNLIFIKSTFLNCYVSNYTGGGFYFNGKTCYILNICGFNCSTEGSPDSTPINIGMFSRTISKFNNINNFSSIHFCADKHIYDKNRVFSYLIEGGSISINNLNSSKIFFQRYSGLSSTSFENSIMKFSTFYNCSLRLYCLVLSHSSLEPFLMQFCNIVENHQIDHGMIRAHLTGKINISNSIFKNNYNILFFSNIDAFIFVHSSSLIHSFSFSSGNIFFQNTLTLNTPTFLIYHINFNKCYAENPINLTIFSFCFTNFHQNLFLSTFIYICFYY